MPRLEMFSSRSQLLEVLSMANHSDDEFVQDLARRMREILTNKYQCSPHERLGFPPILKGQDVSVYLYTFEATLEKYKKLSVN